MAFLVFQSTAAETGFVAAGFCCAPLPCRQYLHDFIRVPAAAQQLRHDPHGLVRMFEKGLVSFTEVIQPGLTIRSFKETVLGAFAITDREEPALAAGASQGVPLVSAERALLIRCHEIDHWRCEDIAEIMVRFDKVVAGIEIAIMFQRHAEAAGGSEDADGPGLSEPSRQGAVEVHDKHPPHVAPHPFVKDFDQEISPLFRTDGTLRYRSSLLVTALVVTLHDWYELDEGSMELITEEAVDLQGIPGVSRIDRTQDIEFDLVFLKQPCRLHDPIERPVAGPVFPVKIVQLPRSVDTQADEEVMVVEEAAPCLIDQYAVGLEGVLDRGPGLPAPVLQLYGPSKKIESHERRLAPLPGNGHPGHLVRFEKLPNKCFMNLVRHPEIAARVELFLLQEEAVVAPQIA